MESSGYKDTRKHLASAVNGISKDFNLVLCGSFLTGCFHLPLSMDYSFSDIDLATEVRLDDKECMRIKKSIRNHLFDRFGIDFRVSIRNQGIFRDVENRVSQAVAMLEALSKFMDKPLNQNYSHYQLTKLYLKIVHSNSYFTNGISFEHGLYKGMILEKCRQIKTEGGLFTNLEIATCIKEIERVSSDIGKDIKLAIDSGVLIEDIYRRYSSVLIANNATEHIVDLRSKIDMAKQAANDRINWDAERFCPLF